MNVNKRGPFNVLGNLAYYPSGVNTNDHLFYFNLLLSNYAKPSNEEGEAWYRRIAEKTKNEGAEIIFNRRFSVREYEDNRFFTDLEQIMKILRYALDYEKRNEQNYVSNKAAAMTRVFSEESQIIDKMWDNLAFSEEFDYINFINLLNSLLQGTKDTLANYDQELKNIEQISKQMKDMEQAVTNQIEGLAQKSGNIKASGEMMMIDSGLKKLNKAMKKTYLTSGTFDLQGPISKTQEHLRKYLTGTKSASSKLAGKIDEVYSRVATGNEIIKNIQSTFEEYIPTDDYSAMENQVKNYIIKEVTSRCEKEIDMNLVGDLGLDLDQAALDLVNNLNQSFDIEVTGLFSIFTQYGKKVKFFDSTIDQLEKKQASARNLYDALNNFIVEVDNKLKASEMTEEQRKVHDLFLKKSKQNPYYSLLRIMRQLDQAAKDIKGKTKTQDKAIDELNASFEKYEDKMRIRVSDEGGKFILEVVDDTGKKQEFFGLNGKSIFSSTQSLSKMASSFKGMLSKKIKQTLIDAFLAEREKFAKDTIAKEIQRAMSQTKVTINGPRRQELGKLLKRKGNLEKLMNGNLVEIKTNPLITTIKSPLDGSTITLQMPVDDFLSKVGKDLTNNLTRLYNDYQFELTQGITKYLGEERREQGQGEIGVYQKKVSRFSELSDEIRRLSTEIEKKFDEAVKKVDSLQESQERKKEILEKLKWKRMDLIDEIQNTIVVDSISSNMNTYLPEVGFVGGSLGANITEQIENLNDTFSSAGIELDREDIDWLITAAINSTSLSIGQNNRDLLETYLGSLAVFALFNNGGEELNLIQNKIFNYTNDIIDSPKILHIYNLNGIFYPGSYVLTSILNNLEEMIAHLKSTYDSYEGKKNLSIVSSMSVDMLPNKGKTDDDPTLDTNPWKTVSESALKHTSIRVVFLAGLIDTIRDLRKQMGEVVSSI